MVFIHNCHRALFKELLKDGEVKAGAEGGHEVIYMDNESCIDLVVRAKVLEKALVKTVDKKIVVHQLLCHLGIPHMWCV